MDYIAKILKKEEEELRHILKETKKELCERVQDERNEINELTLEGREGREGYAVGGGATCVRGRGERSETSHAPDVVIEPAATHARPIFWERMSTGAILGPAQPELLAMVGRGLQASYWVVVTYQGAPVWINADSLRSKRQFEAQGRPAPMPPLTPAPPVKPNPGAIEQPSLEFSDGR